MQLKNQEMRKCKKCQIWFQAKTATRQCLKCRSSIKLTKKETALARSIPVKKKSSLLASKIKKPKEKTAKKLRKELDEVFSIYIRRSYADSDGNVQCVTCPKIKPWKEMQNGHFVGRANMNLRWSEKNCYPQCFRCNCMLKGNYPAYTEFLLNRIGLVGLQNLITEGKMIKKWTSIEIKEMIEFYKEKIKSF